MSETKSYFKSKTLWLNFTAAFLGIIASMFQSSPMDPQIVGLIVGGIGAVNMFLRSITTTAVGSGS